MLYILAQFWSQPTLNEFASDLLKLVKLIRVP